MFESATTPPTYRALHLVLRPARTTTFIWPEDWHITATRMMECYARTWGGVGNLVVPTTKSGAINPRLWPLLAAFDPDSYATYQPTRRGQHMANPEGFEDWLEEAASEFARRNSMSVDAARASFLEDHIYRSPISKLELDEPTTDHIRHWMSPLVLRDLVLTDWFMADSKTSSMNGLTDLMDLALTPGELVTIQVSDLPPEIQLLVDTRIGAIAPSFRAELEADGWAITEIDAGPDLLDALLDLAWRGQIDPSIWRLRSALAEAEGEAPLQSPITEEGLLDKTPFTIGLVGCDSFAPFTARWDDRPIHVVVGNTAEDYSLALGLDRGWSSGIWLPLSLIDGSTDLGSELSTRVVRALGSVLDRMTRHRTEDDDVIRLTSLSVGLKGLESVAEMIRDSIWGDRIVPVIADAAEIAYPQPQRVLDKAYLSETRHIPFTGENMVSGLNPPLLPSEARGKAGPNDCHWYVNIDVDSLSVPTRSDLTDSVRQGDLMRGGKMRPSREGIAVYSHRMGLIPGGATLEQVVERPRIRVPDAPEIFRTLLRRRKLRAELSDKGKYATATIERWGGLGPTVASLRDDTTYAILHSYVTPKGQPRPGVSLIDEIGSGRRHYLAMPDVTRIADRSAEDCIELLDGLVQRRVLRRGLVLKCLRCDFGGWYDLAHIDQGFECGRCSERQAISRARWREPVEQPSFYYDLDEAVYQALSNDAAVTLLTLGEIADRSRAFMYSPEMELYEEGATKPFCEIDIWAVSNGQLFVGEAKRGGSIGNGKAKQSAAKLARVAEAVSADVVVLATASEEWQASSVDLVTKHLEGLPTRLETLTNIAAPRPWE